MEYIYTRVSTDKQQTNNQLHLLTKRYPNATIVEETISGFKQKPQLDALINKLQSGDKLIVIALDRLGRKMLDVITLIEDLSKRDIILVSLREGLDYATPTGRLVTQILAAVAELERSLISERTKEALAARKAKGMRLGAPIKIDAAIKQQARQLRSQGLSLRDIAKLLNVSHSTVQLAIKAA